MTTPHDLDERFRAAVTALPTPAARRDPNLPLADDGPLTGADALDLFGAQLVSRHLDLAARWLRSFGEGFHTIGAAGHEITAALAHALRPTDPVLAHHRSAALWLVRAAQHGRPEAARDLLRGIVAAATDPASGGRHRSYGCVDLHLLPTTGLYGAHLPRALGVAFAIERAPRLRAAGGPRSPWPQDAIAVAGFGDGALHHTSASAALTAAGWCDRSGLRLPLLLVCEDNGIAGSVRSPDGWTADLLRSRPGLRYFSPAGADLPAGHAAASEAVAWVRRHRRPAILRLRTVRLMGHAAGDPERSYRPAADIAHDLAADPLVATARILVAAGIITPEDVIARYDEVGWRIRKGAEEALAEPKLADAAAVAAPIAPRRPVRVAREITDAARHADAGVEARSVAFGGELPEHAGPLTLAETITAALADALLANPAAVLFGPDVAGRGGAYGITCGLRDRFGPSRVFDTLCDETAVVGLGLGAAVGGLLPIAELSHLGYLRGADEQLRGQGATAGFISGGAMRNPMVLRAPGLAYDPAGGGMLHSDTSLAALRDTPGLIVAVPSRAQDAAPMLRACVAAAAVDGSVCVIVEPAALYDVRDLHADGDDAWTSRYAPPARWAAAHVPVGRARAYQLGSGADLTIATFGNGVRMSLRVARELADDDIGVRVVDLRWLSPLPTADLAREAAATGRVLIVDETRRSGGVGEGIIAALLDAGFVGAARRVAAADSFIPMGPAARHVLVGEDAIRDGALALVGR
ncbi:transketolase C-terminal domain-containing protein [Pilimelia columellifera]|uniref:Thiamine pyrophosphate-dependent enzyme n=1 Tax=Pilimelia columellifera subsp. columellifera TaxID=706583 RepID=A0ABN3NH49_9ACTN